MHCVVYKSPKRDLVYLFVPEADQFDDVPQPLMQGFGEPQWVMELELEPGKQLAYTTADEVIAKLDEQGYHLQMPPRDPWL